MAVREIPQGSIEIQTGLWAYHHTFALNGVTYSNYRLYSAEGYCFYDKNDQYTDEEGNIIPEDEVQPNQRIYAQYAVLAASYDTVEKINADFVSVPVQDDYEIVSVGNDHETV